MLAISSFHSVLTTQSAHLLSTPLQTRAPEKVPSFSEEAADLKDIRRLAGERPSRELMSEIAGKIGEIPVSHTSSREKALLSLSRMQNLVHRFEHDRNLMAVGETSKTALYAYKESDYSPGNFLDVKA